MRSKPFVSANFDNNCSLLGGGDFDNFFQKMSKSPPYARPPSPSGLTLIGALVQRTRNKKWSNCRISRHLKLYLLKLWLCRHVFYLAHGFKNKVCLCVATQLRPNRVVPQPFSHRFYMQMCFGMAGCWNGSCSLPPNNSLLFMHGTKRRILFFQK